MAPRATPSWGQDERSWFAAAIAASPHASQKTVAGALVDEHQAAHASQALVSRWLSGDIRMPGCVPSLLSYCRQYAPQGPPTQASGPPPPDPTDLSAARIDALRRELAAAKQTATDLRKQVDDVRGLLRVERRHSKSLASTVRDLGRQLAEAKAGTDTLDDIATSYSTELTRRDSA